MEEKQIRVFHTHIEVYPYILGENQDLEHKLSLWIDAEYRYKPYAYFVNNDVLYLPRGYNINALEKIFHSTAFTIKRCDEYGTFTGIKKLYGPKNKAQEDGIKYLSCQDEFERYIVHSQQALVLQTGEGKTIAAIYSIINHGMKAIIITHQNKIKEQWIESLLDKTDCSEDMFLDISGTDVMNKIMDTPEEDLPYAFYFVNHQTIQSYVKQKEDWLSLREFMKHIKVGIKVYDEAHIEFQNILRIDFFSNTMKTFYLTANFDRSDKKEKSLFKMCFSASAKFGEVIKDYTEKRYHIIYVPVIYRSNPSINYLNKVVTKYGFSTLNFSTYALHKDWDKTMLKVFIQVFTLANRLDGKMLITVPRINDTEYIKSELLERFPNLDKKIMTIHSGNSKEDNDYAKEHADIICSTIRSCGTGVDIPGLRIIINMEPFSSNIIANQLSGRLREYAKDKDTYFFDLIDIAFKQCEEQMNLKIKYLKKKCKEIQKFYV